MPYELANVILAATKQKPSRLNIRVSEHQKEVLTRAAQALNTTVSSFVLHKAYAEAQAILGNQGQFRLPEKQWRAFVRALDARPKKSLKLKKLLTESGVFGA